MEVGEEGDYYTYRYTVTTRMTPAVMRDTLMSESVSLIQLIVRDSHKTSVFEEKGEPKRIRTEVPLLPSLAPYRLAKPAHSRL